MDRVYDVAIIGAGVTGCAIARKLSQFKLSAAVVDMGADVAMGASHANSAIVHAGYDCAPGSLMAKLNVEGNALFDEWCGQLDAPLYRCGSFVIAFSEYERHELAELLHRGEQNGVPGLKLLTGDEARAMEPELSADVIEALYAPTGGITCPYELTIAMSENARANGVEFLLERNVRGIACSGSGFNIACESRIGNEAIRARYIVNAAGVYADEISALIGDKSFSIGARKGEYMLLDKQARCISTVIFQTPSKLGKGVLVAPTVDGNIFAGPTALDMDDKSDTSTTDVGLAELKRLSTKSVPKLNLRMVITSFAGVRAVPSTGDFIIETSDVNPHFIHAAGIASPGLSSSPAIANYVAEILAAQGLALEPDATATPIRKAIRAYRHMSTEELAQAYAENPLYGRMICRCESVTEAEIVEAIHRGATTVDGVKRRTRAGMGRCQGGFCMPRVMDILSRELNIPMDRLTKSGGESYLLAGKLGEVHYDA